MWLERSQPRERRERRMSTIAQQIQELERLSVSQLAERYQELHGRPPRNKNRMFLRGQGGWKLQGREFGGLSDRARARLDERIGEIDLPLGAPEPRRSARA